MKRIVRVLWERPRIGLPLGAFALLVVAFAGVSLGLAPITASSGHWTITEWFLHYAMRRSVITWSLTAPAAPDDLHRDAMVLRGAGHYETGCRPCHGSPGEPLPLIPGAMTPHPPRLQPRIGTWDDRELFYIVKHGVKFTGMPAWLTQQRNDEVWAMVAFLRRLPQIDERGYEALVRGGESTLAELAPPAVPDPLAPAIVTTLCARCHGHDGLGRGEGAFPIIAGQRLGYLTKTMQAYAEGRRHSGIMQPIALGLSREARVESARYYALLPRTQREGAPSAGDVAKGERIARQGIPESDVPACAKCHGIDPIEDAYPRLAGQYPGYLAQQLRLLQQRHRGGSEFVHLMHEFVDKLSEEEIENVSAYYAWAPPE